MTVAVPESEPLRSCHDAPVFRSRTLRRGEVQELFITCSPLPGDSPEGLLRRAIASAQSLGVRICRQRVFVPANQLDSFREAHGRVFANEPLPTQWLLSGGDHAAIQIYAVSGARDWSPLRHAGKVCGWSFKCGASSYSVTTGVGGRPSDKPAEQARCAFEVGEQLLAQAGMTLHDVARTWIYMDDILAWYGDLNAVRNGFFAERGLLFRGQSPSQSLVPASTGMGLSPSSGAISIEFHAARGASIDHLPAAGRQRSAYEYGSAFSRATELASPAGRTLFVSGTAAIDPHGRTCFAGDIDGQITMTLQNVGAILQQRGYANDSVVEAVAYCKDGDVERAFRSRLGNAPQWPWVIAVGDICRSDLLFEVEATAIRSEGASCV